MKIILALWALLFGLLVGAQAEEIQLRHKGLTLNATLTLANNHTLADGVILMTHGTLMHKDAEIMATLAELFQEQGYNTLAHTLSLGMDDRRGMYDCAIPHRHRHIDAVDEIGVWLDWLRVQGVSKIALLGHSRGANQVAWFAAEYDRPELQAVVLLGPSTRRYENRYIRPMLPVLARAQALHTQQTSVSALLHTDFLFCKSTMATAAAIVSYYAPEPRRDTPFLLLQIDKPALVLVAGDDEIVPDVAEDIVPSPRIQVQIIEDADHFFRDLHAEDAVEAIAEFLNPFLS